MKLIYCLLVFLSAGIAHSEEYNYSLPKSNFVFHYQNSINLNTPFYVQQSIEQGRTFGTIKLVPTGQIQVLAPSMGEFFSNPFEGNGLTHDDQANLMALALESYAGAFNSEEVVADNGSTEHYANHQGTNFDSSNTQGNGSLDENKFFACAKNHVTQIESYLKTSVLFPERQKDLESLKRKILASKASKSPIAIGCGKYLNRDIILLDGEFVSIITDEKLVLDSLMQERVNSNSLTKILQLRTQAKSTSAKALVMDYLFERVSEEFFFKKIPVSKISLPSIIEELKEFDFVKKTEELHINGKVEVREANIDFSVLKTEIMEDLK